MSKRYCIGCGTPYGSPHEETCQRYTPPNEIDTLRTENEELKTKVEAWEDHIADLRNKYSRINTYFYMSQADYESGLDPDQQEIMSKLLDTIFADNERFVELLKEDR